jgi:hypothetical protein
MLYGNSVIKRAVTYRKKGKLMRIKNFVLITSFIWLFFSSGLYAEIRWPGEKKFEGMSSAEEIQSVFFRDTSAYDRRYLIQAVPIFFERNKISVVPSWLVKEIGRAIVSNDFNLAYEGIIAAQRLNLTALSDSMSTVYRKARQISPGEMPEIHTAVVGTLVGFNTEDARHALAKIISTPLPAKIAQDIVPALKGLYQIGDSSCLSALDNLSMRLQQMNDSLSNKFKSAKSTEDSLLNLKAEGMLAGTAKVRQMINERAGKK